MKQKRVKTGFAALDKALGGGIILPSTMLLKGQPGVGKSTLMLHVCEHIVGDSLLIEAQKGIGPRVVFVVAESERGSRHQALGSNILLSHDVEQAKSFALLNHADIVVIDCLNAMRIAGKRWAHTSVLSIARDLIDFAMRGGKYENREGKPFALILVNYGSKRQRASMLDQIVDTVMVICTSASRDVAWKLNHRLVIEKNRYGKIGLAFKFDIDRDWIQERKGR